MSQFDVFTTSMVHRPTATECAQWRPQLAAELQRCEAACRSFVDAAPDGADLERWRSGIALAASCAEICAMTVALLARSDHGVRRLSCSALELCAQACVSCAAECDRLSGPAALRCGDACRSVLRDLSEVSPIHSPGPVARGPRWSLDPV